MPDGYQPATREQTEAQRLLAAEAFGGDPATALDRVDDAYIARTRVVEHRSQTAAALHFFDAGQFFHGRRLRCWAVAGLVTAPASRGTGVGRELVLGHLHEAREQGVPLSALYASTPAFYRKCGYEPAGDVCAWGVDSHRLPGLPGALDDYDVVPFAPDDEHVRNCYTAFARTQNGNLDRDAELWRYKLDPPRGHRFRYRFDRGGRTEGYVSISGDRSDGLAVEDYAATTLRARHAIVRFLHGHRAVNGKVVWYGGPHDPLRQLIPDNWAFARPHTEEWLLRITDVSTALQQRGYPPIDAELHLDVADHIVPANAGRWVLCLRQGTPSIEPGGDGRVGLDVRGLAALFTGQRTTEELALTGLAEGDVADLATASRVFAGPRPYMVDKF